MVRNSCLSVCEYIANDLTTVPKVIVRESYLSFPSLYLTLQLLQVPLRSVPLVHSKSSRVFSPLTQVTLLYRGPRAKDGENIRRRSRETW